MPRNSGQRNAEKSREAILQAAESLFARKGTRRVSLAEIAKQAGVSRGLPSYFFHNKGTVSRTVMERAAERVRRSVLDPIRSFPQTNPSQILSELIDRYIDYLAANPYVVKLLHWDALERTAERKTRQPPNIPANVLLEAVQVLAERVGKKRIGGMEIIDLLRSIVAMCLFPFQHSPPSGLAFVQQHKRHIKKFVLRAIKERK